MWAVDDSPKVLRENAVIAWRYLPRGLEGHWYVNDKEVIEEGNKSNVIPFPLPHSHRQQKIALGGRIG